MRFLSVLVVALALSGCSAIESIEDTVREQVDATSLESLTSRERALLISGDEAMQHGRYGVAERDYKSAVEISTGHIDAHLSLARLYEKQDQADKAREVLAEALELQPDEPLANYLFGKIELSDMHYTEALDAFERGLKRRPDDLDLNIGKGIAHDMLGNHKAAQKVYARAIRANPNANTVNIRTNLAMSYLLGGNTKKAIELLQADAKKPNAPAVTRHNLALAYGLLGRHAEATALLDGDIDEETRLLSVARLKEYLKEREDGDAVPPIAPTIHPAKLPESGKAKPVKSKVRAEKPPAEDVYDDAAEDTDDVE